MNEILTILSERVDDIPLLLAQVARMGVQPLLDAHFPTHGNWHGLSLGWVTVIWLTHILSQADHRLNHVEPWVEKRLHTLRGCTGQPLHPLDVSDDRLALVLQALSDDARWSTFESALTQQLVRVYTLRPERVRLDSTTASGSWAVTPEGLFQFGHSKDHRPDLPQVKVMLSTLDPLGLPLATAVIPGHHADDPLYIPAVRQVRASLGQHGLLYVGDCKMAALETRAFLHAGQDFYLCPLSALQVPAALLDAYLAPIWTGKQEVTPIYRHQTPGDREQMAEGYEVQEPLTAVVAGERCTWTERRLVIRSPRPARARPRCAPGWPRRRPRWRTSRHAAKASRGARRCARYRRQRKRSWPVIASKACCGCTMRNTCASARSGATARGQPPCESSGRSG